MRISCDVESETGSADPGDFPDSQPRRDPAKVRHGLLGFLDDLRTRVKPTRGVLDLPLMALQNEDVLEGKSSIIAAGEDSCTPANRPSHLAIRR
jgi:hypothetical protein